MRLRPIRVAAWLLAASIGLLLAIPANSAAAHPSGTYTINRYARIELYQQHLVLVYIADYSEIPSLGWSVVNDQDGDNVISNAEVGEFLVKEKSRLLEELTIEVGNEHLELVPVSHAASFLVTDLGQETLRYEVTYEAPVDVTSESDLSFSDSNFQGIQGWRALTIVPSPGTVTSPLGILLSDPSQGLTTTPEDWKSSPPNIRRVTFSWNPATGAALARPEVTVPVVPSEPSVVATGSPKYAGSTWALVAGLFVAVLLGAIDAFGPGHGKTVVGSYLAGNRRASYGDAALVGLVAAVVHSVVVVLLGLLALQASQRFLPDAVRWFGLASGLGIVALGIGLLVFRGRVQGHVLCAHTDEESLPRSRSKAVVVGALSALIPCPTGIVLLLSAVAAGQSQYGIALAVAFSLGTAAALLLVGVGVVFLRSLSDGGTARWERVAGALPVVSAGLMVVSGLVITRAAAAGNVL